MRNIIIDIKKDASRVYEYLYRRNFIKNKIKKEKEVEKIENFEIEILKIPYCRKFNIKTAERFIKNNFGDEKVNVILSKNVKKIKELNDFFEKNIKLCQGTEVLSFFYEDIFKKYLILKGKKDYEAEIVIFCDDENKTYEFLKKVCKKIKNAYIVPENLEKFDWVIKSIYDEFGFFIYYTKKSTNCFLSDRIYLNFAENKDFYIKDAEKNNIIILDFLGNSKKNDMFITKFNFGLPIYFKNVMKYFNGCDQRVLEFLVYSSEKSANLEDTENFCKSHNINLKKICIKNS